MDRELLALVYEFMRLLICVTPPRVGSALLASDPGTVHLAFLTMSLIWVLQTSNVYVMKHD